MAYWKSLVRVFACVAVCLPGYRAESQMTADFVYGQPSLYSSAPGNTAMPPEGRLYAPRGCAVDSEGVYISDHGFNRVLFFQHGSNVATRVYGQPGYTT